MICRCEICVRSDAPPPGTYKPKNGINNYPKYESNLPRTRHAFASSEPRAMSADAP